MPSGRCKWTEAGAFVRSDAAAKVPHYLHWPRICSNLAASQRERF